MKPTRIVIVDDHAIFRQGLRKLFEDYPEFCVVGEASNGTEAVDLVRQTDFDILLLDLRLGDITGLDVLRRVSEGAKFHTILLGADIEPEDELNAILLGACGIVRKHAASETLFKSIRSVLAGENWISQEVMRQLVGIHRTKVAPQDIPSAHLGLTARELDIVDGVVQGLGNKGISDLLGISPFTVKHHLTRIFTKLGVTNRVELVMLAQRHGLTGNVTRAQTGDNRISAL